MNGALPRSLVSSKEKDLFLVSAILSVLAWLVLTIFTFGMIWVLLAIIAIVVWFSNGLLVAGLRSEAVEVHAGQVARLHASFMEVCDSLRIAHPPRLYVIESGGMLNAFATRHSGRHFVVVYADILDALGPDSPEMRFVLGHELGHIHRNHVLRRLLLAPALFLPIIGPAYSRACESTCDRYGATAAGDSEAAMRALMVMAGGKETGRELDIAYYSRQNREERGFFVSWYELISGYPTLSRRVTDLLALHGQRRPQAPPRNPLGYLFALFSFGGGYGGRGSFITTLLTIYFIGILAALALPAISGALKRGQATQMLAHARQIQYAVEKMDRDRVQTAKLDLGWPADSNVATVEEFQQRLVDGGYLTPQMIKAWDWSKFEVGNVSNSDPADTIFLRNKSVVFYKGGDGKVLRPGEKPPGQDPPRTPAYLAP